MILIGTFIITLLVITFGNTIAAIVWGGIVLIAIIFAMIPE